MTSFSAWLMISIASLASGGVAELSRARRRRLHGVDEALLDRAVLEHADRALGGAALRRHLRAQRRRFRGGRLGEAHRARERRIGELARIGLAEAELHRRRGEPLEEIEH